MKRCPFCGSKGKLLDICSMMSVGCIVTWAVYCTKCPCRTKEAQTQEEAIKNWDTRFEDTVAEFIVAWSSTRITIDEAYHESRRFIDGKMGDSLLHDALIKEFGK